MSKITYTVQDNWATFNYNKRFLDALAALFHCQSECAAVLEYEHKFYLSYNSNITKQNKKYVELINKILAESVLNSDGQNNILGIYLTFNREFKDLVKKTRNHVNADSRELLEQSIKILQTTEEFVDRNIKKILSGEIQLNFNSITTSYSTILDNLRNDKNLHFHVNTFLRPLQDASKLFFYLSNNNYQNFNIVPLENNNGFHAEYNITIHFPKTSLLDKNYIGISKLCCGYCHKSLEEDGYLHRGTHGMCDNEWQIGPQSEKFKNSVNSIAEFNQADPPPQHRKLSFDNFEQNLAGLHSFKVGFFQEQKEEKEEENNIVTVGITERSAESSNDNITENNYIPGMDLIGSNYDGEYC